MATETLFPDGTYSGTGWTGTGSNITEGITAADGNEISSDAGGEGDVVTIDMANSALVDGDTITNVSIQVRGRVTNDGGDESFTVELVIGGAGQGTVTGTPGELNTGHQNTGSRNTAGWNSDWTAAQLDGMQVDVVGVQTGMPTANTWHIDTLEVVITYTPGVQDNPENPLTGELDLTGAIPTLFTEFIQSPGIMSPELTLTGHIPLAIHPREEAPADGSLTLTGAIPIVTVGQTIPVDGTSLTLTGYIEYNYGGPGLRLIGFEPELSIDAAAGGGDLTEDPLLGSAVLTGVAPAIIVNHIIGVPAGAIVLTGLAPVAFVQMFVDPGEDVLVLTGAIPERITNYIRGPPVGSVALGGLTPTIDRFVDPTTGSVALTGQAPTLDTTVTSDVGSAALTGYIPTLDYTWVVHPDVGSLSLTGLAPADVQDNIELPAPDSLALTGQVPSINFSWVVYPDIGSLALTGEIPVTLVGNNAQPDIGSLSLTGQTPSISFSWVVYPDAGNLSLAGEIPVSDLGGVTNATVEPGTGSLALTGYLEYNYGGPGLRLIGYEPSSVIAAANDDIVVRAAGTLTLTGQAPSLLTGITSAAGTLTLTGAIPEITIPNDHEVGPPGLDSLAITGLIPTLDHTVDVIGYEQPGSLSLTGYDLALSTGITDATIPVPVGSLGLTGYLEYNYGGPGLRLIGYEPELDSTSAPAIIPAVSNLLLETHAPSIEITIDGGFELLILTGQQPTVTRTTDIAGVDAGSLSLAGFTPTIANTSPAPTLQIPVLDQQLALTGQAPSLSYSWTVYPDAGTATLTGYGFNFDVLIPLELSPGPVELALTGYAPQAKLGVPELVLTGYAPSVFPRMPVDGELTLTGLQPTLFRTQRGGAGKNELRELGAKRKKEQKLREETRKRVEEHKEELVEKIFGTPSVLKEVLETGKGEVSGMEVEMPPLPKPQFPIDALAPELAKIKDGMDREIATLIRAQEEATFNRQLAEHQLKVERMEEELIAFLILAMDD